MSSWPAVQPARVPIGRKIRGYREAVGINQTQLAEMVGVSANTICRMEQGRAPCSVEMLEEIANALGYEVSISWFKRRK